MRLRLVPRTTSRRGLVGALFSVAALAGSLVGIPAASALGRDALPVLWEGKILDPAGQPAAAEVVALLRPPPEALVPGVPLVPLARTTTDNAGGFSLRSLPTPALTAMTGESGWLTVMLAAFTHDGMSMAVDSVAWHGGRWITDPAELASGAASDVTSTNQRPKVLTTVALRTPSGEDRDQGHAPKGVGSCWMTSAKGAGDHYVAVGELHLDRDWGGMFEYSQSRYSSFQIGVSHEGSGWSVGGSVSMAKNTKFEVPHDLPSEARERFWTWKAHMDFKRFGWGCNKGYPEVHHAATLEPVEWRGGLPPTEGGDLPTCNPEHKATFGPGAKPKRQVGSSVTLTGAITVPGFTGSMTSAFSESVVNQWINPTKRNRQLCGESDDLTKDTRVLSLP